MKTRGLTVSLVMAALGAAPAQAETPAGPVAAVPANGFAPALAIIGIGDVQRQLSRHGYDPGPATGAINDATYRAILAYQHDYGLPQDGVAGPALQNELHFLPLRPVVPAAAPPPAPTAMASDAAPPAGPSAAPPLVAPAGAPPPPTAVASLDPAPKAAPRTPVAVGDIAEGAAQLVAPPAAALVAPVALAPAVADDAAALKADESVRAAQTYLKELGLYDGEIDGIFGWPTVQALIAFDASGRGPAAVIADPTRPENILLARLKTAAATARTARPQ